MAPKIQGRKLINISELYEQNFIENFESHLGIENNLYKAFQRVNQAKKLFF